MPCGIQKQGLSATDQYDVFIATLDEKKPALLAHLPGSDVITIHGNTPGWGATEIKGKKELLLLRDALIELCRREGFESEVATVKELTPSQKAAIYRLIAFVLSGQEEVQTETITMLPEDSREKMIHLQLQAVRTLPHHEGTIIKARYGIDCDSTHNLKEAGKALGTTEERARQIEAQGLRKLRSPEYSAPLREEFQKATSPK